MKQIIELALHLLDWLVVFLAYALIIGGVCLWIERKKTRYIKGGF